MGYDRMPKETIESNPAFYHHFVHINQQEGTVMKTTTSEGQTLLSDEPALLPEDFQKLQLLKEIALTSARRAKDGLPDKVKKLVLTISVNSKLQENAPDQLEIIITFKLTPPSSQFLNKSAPRCTAH